MSPKEETKLYSKGEESLELLTATAVQIYSDTKSLHKTAEDIEMFYLQKDGKNTTGIMSTLHPSNPSVNSAMHERSVPCRFKNRNA